MNNTYINRKYKRKQERIQRVADIKATLAVLAIIILSISAKLITNMM